MTFQDYLNILQTNIRTPKIKVQFLRFTDETPYSEITGDILNSSGNLTINNQNGVRRAIDLTLSNVSGNYIPSPDTLWLGQKFKVYMGLQNNSGETYWISQGVFVTDNPTVMSNYTVSLKGTDKFALLDGTLGGEIDGIYQITLGSNIYTVLKSILSDNNIIQDQITPILDILYKDDITPYTIEKETGATLGEIVLELAALVSANVYYNADGKLVFEQDFNDTVKSSLWDFSANEFNYINSSQTFKFNEVFNAVLVIGDNINGQIFDYQAINNNLQSPTSVPNLGFKRIKVINDSNINTEQRAEDRAKYELKRVMIMQSEFNVDSVPIYHLDVDKIITLTDGGLQLNKERILIDSISIPLSPSGRMSIKAVKSIDLLVA